MSEPDQREYLEARVKELEDALVPLLHDAEAMSSTLHTDRCVGDHAFGDCDPDSLATARSALTELSEAE